AVLVLMNLGALLLEPPDVFLPSCDLLPQVDHLLQGRLGLWVEVALFEPEAKLAVVEVGQGIRLLQRPALPDAEPRRLLAGQVEPEPPEGLGDFHRVRRAKEHPFAALPRRVEVDQTVGALLIRSRI